METGYEATAPLQFPEMPACAKREVKSGENEQFFDWERFRPSNSLLIGSKSHSPSVAGNDGKFAVPEYSRNNCPLGIRLCI